MQNPTTNDSSSEEHWTYICKDEKNLQYIPTNRERPFRARVQRGGRRLTETFPTFGEAKEWRDKQLAARQLEKQLERQCQRSSAPSALNDTMDPGQLRRHNLALQALLLEKTKMIDKQRQLIDKHVSAAVEEPGVDDETLNQAWEDLVQAGEPLDDADIQASHLSAPPLTRADSNSQALAVGFGQGEDQNFTDIPFPENW